MTNLQWALRYLADEYSVIPLKGDKRPILESWKEYQERLSTEEEVTNWWTQNPDALVGIVTGKVSGISVVDIEAGGDSSIFPATYTVRPGRGGLHLYYDYAEIGNMVRVFPLVDVRGDGGYVVAPPSITHFKVDNHYEGGEYSILDDAPKMPFPVALFQKAQQSNFDPQTLKGVTEGGRNQSAASVAGFLLSKTPASEYQLAWNLLKTWNTLNKPPLDIQELKHTFESILKRESSKEKPEEDIEIVPLSKASEESKKETGVRVSTGFDFLDEASRGGIGAGELWVIAAPQGQGKTTLAMEITLKLAERKVKSLWLSYELLVEELWEKFQDMGAQGDFQSFTTLKPAGGDITVIEKVIKKAVEQEDVKVVFIDHFGRLSGKPEKYDKSMSSNFAVYLALIAERLKMLSLEHKVAIVLMAHTKKPERGRNQTTSDIANTSGLGNEASMSILLDRELDGFDDIGGDKYTGKLFIRIDKSRWGKETTTLMEFTNGRIKPWTALKESLKTRI